MQHGSRKRLQEQVFSCVDPDCPLCEGTGRTCSCCGRPATTLHSNVSRALRCRCRYTKVLSREELVSLDAVEYLILAIAQRYLSMDELIEAAKIRWP